MKILENKTAVITGSSRGIGAASAKLLAAHGARVTVNYAHNKEAGEKVLGEITQAGGEAILVQADATNREEINALIAKTESTFGPVDILVNNANMSFAMAPFAQYQWEDFERKLVNEMKASFYSCQAVVPGMMERKSGCIINVSSGLSRVPGPGFIAHCSAKSALDAFSKTLALELGPHGIRVNVVAPGLTVTDATARQPQEMKDAVANHTPLRRLGQADDIAGAVLFFASDWARFVSGIYLPVSGGVQMT